jgi:hypothetical protein
MALKYKTFDELIASIEGDLEIYSENNLIDSASLIKHAKYVNADLGLKLNKVQECDIQITNYKADLPNDFFSAIHAVAYNIRSMGKVHGFSIPGTQTIEYSREEVVERGLPLEHGCLKKDGGCYYLFKPYTEKEIKITELHPLTPTKKSLKKFTENSLNRTYKSEYTINIDEQEIEVSFKEGTIHLVYLSDLVDEEGNLLVLDHDLTNPYYEYYLKTKIFEKLYFDYNEDVERKYIQMRDILLPKAKAVAINIVATPEYKKTKQYTDNMIRTYYNEYVKMFL